MTHGPKFIGIYSYEHSLNRPAGHGIVLFLALNENLTKLPIGGGFQDFGTLTEVVALGDFGLTVARVGEAADPKACPTEAAFPPGGDGCLGAPEAFHPLKVEKLPPRLKGSP